LQAVKYSNSTDIQSFDPLVTNSEM